MPDNQRPYCEVQGIAFHAYHGAYAIEREQGQTFVVDVALYGDFAKGAEVTDRLDDTIDYAAVCSTVVSIGTTTRVNLLERLAALLGDALIAQCDASKVTVTVSKRPPAGTDGDPARFTVRVSRTRGD